MMKIAYILNSNDPMGGATKSFLTMLEGVIESGCHTLVVVPRAGGICPTLQSLGCKVVVLDYRHNIYPYERTLKDFFLWIPRLLFQRCKNAKAVKELILCLKQFQPDIVHTNVSVIDIGQRAAKKLGIPHIYHFREYADIDFSMRYFPSKKCFHQSVTYSICITHGIQAYHGLESQHRSCVIYNPIATQQSMMPVAEGERKYLLFASRIEQGKGLDDLLEAYHIANMNTPLWVAGPLIRPSYTQQLEEKLARWGIQHKVKFLGARSDIAELMRNAKAVIVPSHFEAFGRTTAEAMFQGTLVIGRDTGGTKEQFDNGICQTGGEIGLRFSTIDELTDCLQCAVTESHEDMLKHAFQTVNHLYTTETNVRQVLDFYHKVITSN